MRSISLWLMAKAITRMFIFAAMVLCFPLFAHGVDVPCLSSQYSLTVSVIPAEGGTVNPSGTTCYDRGQIVSIIAIPNADYFFDGWSGDFRDTSNPTSITMDRNSNVEANFTPIAGSLDTTFNPPKGFVTFDEEEATSAVALQADGKIVVMSHNSIFRLNNDGIMDNSFGTNGSVIHEPLIEGKAVAIQTDGKIVVLGSSSFGLTIFRYNNDGTPDTTFGVNGLVTYGALAFAIAGELAIQEDGKIVVLGNSSSNLFILRYQSDGSLDTTFGNGIVVYEGAIGSGMALQMDGKIIVGGNTSEDLLLLRFNNDGTLDLDFGINGASGIGGVHSNAIVPQEDGKTVVVGGHIIPGIPGSIGGGAIVRVQSNGMLDTDFGNDGVITTSDGSYNAAVLQPDGKIIVAGDRRVLGDPIGKRFNNNGSQDTKFGIEVIGVYEFGDIEAKSLAIQPDGKIIAVGHITHVAYECCNNFCHRLCPVSYPYTFVSRSIVKTEQLETISPPALSGPTTGTMLESYTFSAGGSLSNQGHSIEYLFDWGDRTYSSWSSGPFSKGWTTFGTYTIRVQARCSLHPEIRSAWSDPLIVNILPVEIITTPNVLFGPTTGIPGNSYFYSTGGSTSNFGHTIQYFFNWGDGTNSGWLPVDINSASHSWSSPEIFLVKVQARCSTDSNVISNWSGSITVNIGPTIQYTITTNPSGLQIVVDGSTFTAPHTFNWVSNSSHTLSVVSPQNGIAGTRYVYSFWSDGEAQTHSISTPFSEVTYTANFTAKYALTASANPSEGGSVDPPGSNWYDSGQNVPLSANKSRGSLEAQGFDRQGISPVQKRREESQRGPGCLQEGRDKVV